MNNLFNKNQVTEEEVLNYIIVKDNKGIREIYDVLKDDELLGIDTENTGLDPYTGNPLLLQIGNSEVCYIIDTYIPGLDYSPIKKLLEDEKMVKILHNAKYDYKWILNKFNIEMENMHCSMIAERLLNVGKTGAPRRASLAFVCNKYLAVPMDKKVRNNFINRDPIAWPISEREYIYSAKDVFHLVDIYYQQILERDSENLNAIFELEMATIGPIADMELAGCKIDIKKWKENIKKAAKMDKVLRKEIFKCFDPVLTQKNLFGLPPFKLTSNVKLMSFLNRLGSQQSKFEKFKVEDTKEETLKQFIYNHRVFKLLVRSRGYTKIITSYGVDSILKKINPITGRLHSDFNQVQADTGRMSSSNPNLQQIPGFKEDSEDSLDFRSCFIAEEGYDIITADYSQQELRILASISKDETFYKAYTEKDENGNGLDVHKYTAHTVLQVPYAEVTKDQRTLAKTLNFFIIFGGGSFSLSKKLGISEEEAQNFIDSYFDRYYSIKRCLDTLGTQALSRGWSVTKLGRKRYLPIVAENPFEFKKAKARQRRAGTNSPMQGGGADVTKLAIVYLKKAIKEGNYDARAIMVIHDEIVVECKKSQSKKVAKILEEVMIRSFEDIYDTIPMVVDANIGSVWEK